MCCFISESVQNDDAEDDPEYNVLCDDDFTNGNDTIHRKQNYHIYKYYLSIKISLNY